MAGLTLGMYFFFFSKSLHYVEILCFDCDLFLLGGIMGLEIRTEWGQKESMI